MSRRFTNLLYTGLVLYTVILVMLELTTSQENVRNYYSDIHGDIAFYGINTSLSAALLWVIVIIFSVSAAISRQMKISKREDYFFLSQVLIFGYLTFDERFQVHDKGIVIDLLGPYSDLILLMIGLIEALILWKWGRILEQSLKAQCYLGIASILFLLMMVVDAFFPDTMLLRLSLEDLLKIWSNVFFFLFAWTICMNKVQSLVKPPEKKQFALFTKILTNELDG